MTKLYEVFINDYDLYGTGTQQNPVIQNLGLSAESRANFKEYSLTTGGEALKWLPGKNRKVSFETIIAINGKNAWNPFGDMYSFDDENISADSSGNGKSLGMIIYEKFVALAGYCIDNNVEVQIRLADLNTDEISDNIWGISSARLTKFDYKFDIDGTVTFSWEFTANANFKATTKTFKSFNYKAAPVNTGPQGWSTTETYRVGHCLPKLFNKGKFYFNTSKKSECTECVAYWQYYILASYYRDTYYGLRQNFTGSCKSLNVKGRRIDGWWHNYTQKGTVNKMAALYKSNKKNYTSLYNRLKAAKSTDKEVTEFKKFFGTLVTKTAVQKEFIMYAFDYSSKYCKGCTAANGGWNKVKSASATEKTIKKISTEAAKAVKTAVKNKT